MNETYKKNIKLDFLRYNKKYTKLNILREIFINRGFRYSFFMRTYSMYKKENRKLLCIFVQVAKKLSTCKTIEIPLELDVGEGIYIGHFSGITINPKAKLGKNINIHKGVTIGQENRGRRKGTPVIGDRVWIGINSTIVGNIRIGDNVLIAPNSLVNFDVPSNSIVIGRKIKSCENATDGYINNIV